VVAVETPAGRVVPVSDGRYSSRDALAATVQDGESGLEISNSGGKDAPGDMRFA
jgi:hypothetical protein